MAWRETKAGVLANRGLLRARHRYYRDLAPHRNVSPRREPPPTLEAWVASLGSPTRIVVVAAGPTAGDLRPEPGWLHIATNSSEAVVRDHPYVNFLSEVYPVMRYEKLGPQSSSCLGAFYRFETGGRPESAAALARRTIAFTERYAREAPDIVASDVERSGVERENYDLFEGRVKELLGQAVRQYNSGFGATYLGYFLAATLEVPLDLYGLDAGVGGKKHFDGSTMASPSVVGDRVRSKLAALHDLLAAQDHVAVTNHSAFLPTVPRAEGA